MKVTACVVSYNTAAHLPAALRSLTGQTHPDLDVVVVDNASHDGSAEVARAVDGVRVIANRDNRGFAGAANQAVRTVVADTGADALLVCNPDVRLAPDHVAQLVAGLGADPRCASVQGKLRRMDGATPDGHRLIDTTGHEAFTTRLFRNRGENTPDDGRWDTPAEIFGVSGACALYRVEALHDVAVDGEIFDADLFAFFEDVDVDWRLRLRGWRARYTPTAVAEHERGGAGPRRTAVVERLNFSNRLFVVVKNDDAKSLLRALPAVAGTTALKAAELAVTVPRAFVSALPRARLLPRMWHKRRRIQAAATVDPAQVVADWFGPFDYARWVRTWWRRVHG